MPSRRFGRRQRSNDDHATDSAMQPPRGTTAAPASRPSSAIPVSQMNTAAAASVASASGKSKDIRSPHTEPVTEPEDGAGRHHRLLSRGARLRGRPCLQSPPAAVPNSDGNQAPLVCQRQGHDGENAPRRRPYRPRTARLCRSFTKPWPGFAVRWRLFTERAATLPHAPSDKCRGCLSVRDWCSCRHQAFHIGGIAARQGDSASIQLPI